MHAFDYREPSSLTELIDTLAGYGSRARLLAGGTDLLLQMEAGKRTPECVIALNRVPELRGITESETGTTIGAMVTLREVELHPGLMRQFPFLTQAAAQVGSVPVRNLATLVGNLANAAPSADTVPALFVAGATVRVTGPRGERNVPVESIMTGPGQTSLAPDELLVSVTLPPPPPGFTGLYLKHSLRMAMDLAFVGVAVSVVRTNGHLGDIRIALGAVAPTVIRASAAETLLRGQAVTPELIAAAAAAAAETAKPIDDVRASADYRRAMVATLTARAIAQLCE